MHRSKGVNNPKPNPMELGLYFKICSKVAPLNHITSIIVFMRLCSPADFRDNVRSGWVRLG